VRSKNSWFALLAAVAAFGLVSSPALAATNSWAATTNMNSVRAGHTATILTDGRVLVAGGGYDASAEIYDPASAIWTLTAPMNVSRGRHAAVRLSDGRVLVVAGNVYNAASAEIYNPATNTWVMTGSLNVPRNYPTAVLLNTGQVLVVGGQNPNTGGAIGGAELFNPGTGTWSLTGSLKTGRYPLGRSAVQRHSPRRGGLQPRSVQRPPCQRGAVQPNHRQVELGRLAGSRAPRRDGRPASGWTRARGRR